MYARVPVPHYLVRSIYETNSGRLGWNWILTGLEENTKE